MTNCKTFYFKIKSRTKDDKVYTYLCKYKKLSFFSETDNGDHI